MENGLFYLFFCSAWTIASATTRQLGKHPAEHGETPPNTASALAPVNTNETPKSYTDVETQTAASFSPRMPKTTRALTEISSKIQQILQTGNDIETWGIFPSTIKLKLIVGELENVIETLRELLKQLFEMRCLAEARPNHDPKDSRAAANWYYQCLSQKIDEVTKTYEQYCEKVQHHLEIWSKQVNLDLVQKNIQLGKAREKLDRVYSQLSEAEEEKIRLLLHIQQDD